MPEGGQNQSPWLPALTGAVADALQAAWQRLAPKLGRVLTWSGQGQPPTLWTQDDDHDLGQDLQTPLVLAPMTNAFASGAQDAAAVVGIVWNKLNDAAHADAMRRAAEMVGRRLDPRTGRLLPNPNAKWRITDSTRADLESLIRQVTATPALSYQDLKERIEEHPSFSGLFGEYRAEMIARTELAMAANRGATDSYQKAGIARVLVRDNPDCRICGPFANTTQTLDWADRNPTGHPNCIRAFSPILPPMLSP